MSTQIRVTVWMSFRDLSWEQLVSVLLSQTNTHTHTLKQRNTIATLFYGHWNNNPLDQFFFAVDLFSAYCRGMQMMLYVLMLSTSCRLLLATLYDDDGVIIKYRMPLTQHLLGSDQRLFSLNHCRVEQGREEQGLWCC